MERKDIGKTPILQRVNEMMENPIIYWEIEGGNDQKREEKVCGSTLLCTFLISLSTRSSLTYQRMVVTIVVLLGLFLGL